MISILMNFSLGYFLKMLKKRTYNEYDKNPNELKKFWESIKFKPALKNSNS